MDILSAAWPHFFVLQVATHNMSEDGCEAQKQGQAATALVTWTTAEEKIDEMEEELWKLRRKVEDSEKMEALRDMLDERKADTLVENEKKIRELEKKLEDSIKVRNNLFDRDLSGLAQVDGTSDDRGQSESQDRAGGWDPKEVERMNSEDIMRRTVLARFVSAEGLGRASFLQDIKERVGLDNLVALGIAGNSLEWHITTRTVQQAKELVNAGELSAGGLKATLSFLQAPSFRIRLFWLPFYVPNSQVIAWLSDNYDVKAQEVRMEKSAVGPISHVATLTREIWLTGGGEKVRENLPDTTWATIGGRRFRILVSVQGRPAKCHKCGERGHMRRNCVFCMHCKNHLHDTHNCEFLKVRHVGPTDNKIDVGSVQKSVVLPQVAGDAAIPAVVSAGEVAAVPAVAPVGDSGNQAPTVKVRKEGGKDNRGREKRKGKVSLPSSRTSSVESEKDTGKVIRVKRGQDELGGSDEGELSDRWEKQTKYLSKKQKALKVVERKQREERVDTEEEMLDLEYAANVERDDNMVTESEVVLEGARGPGGVDGLEGALDDGGGQIDPLSPATPDMKWCIPTSPAASLCSSDVTSDRE